MNRPRIRAILLLGFVIAGATTAFRFRAADQGLATMEALVRSKFPKVRQITPAEAQALLGKSGADRPQLLDVRSEAEFHVSRIPGAIRIDPDSNAAGILPKVDPSRPVVVYCAVGYRSSELATRLINEGITNVANIQGSIFAWANAGLPLVSDTGAVFKVHPYNGTFGRMVKPEYRAKVPDLP
jgi:rhodanese-related sulfurtransferase